MKNLKKQYREKFLNELQPQNDLDKMKKDLDFKSNQKVYRKSPKQKIIFSSLSAVLACCIIVTLTLVIITYTNAPVYEKMEIMDDTTVKTVGKLNHFGSPMLKLDEELNDPEKDIIENDMPDVITDDSIKYYAEKGSEVIFKISISNPKKFEILSFTLNDYKYQSYEFLEGSTGEVIYVKVNVSDVSGIETFYINELKYVDGDKIRNARYNGERTIKVGVTYEFPPKSEIISSVVTQNTFEVVLREIDQDNLILDGTAYRGYLFSDKGLVMSKSFQKGLQSFTITTLNLNTEYEFMVACSVDLLDGDGVKTIYMYDEVFTTSSGLTEPKVVSTENSLQINFTPINTSVKILGSRLYLDGSEEVYQEITGTDVLFENILSNNLYNVEVDYQYTVDNQVVIDTWKSTVHYQDEIKTLAYEVPTLDFTLTPEHHQVSLAYNINDPFNLGQITNVEVYRNDVLQEVNKTATSINDLFADNTYKIVVTYTYDLNDGTGEHEFKVEKEVHTLSYTKPSIDGLAIFAGSKNILLLDFYKKDPDNLCTVNSVEVFYQDTKITDEVLNLDSAISNIDPSYDELKVVVTYSFDMKDGLGTQTETYTHVVKRTI